MVSLFILLSFYFTNSIDCYTLSQGGGGIYGAYEAGVFKGLANNLPTAEISYYAYIGISAGSLNSLTLSQFAIGDELAASEYLIDVYLSLNGTSSIFTEWPGGLIDGLLFRSGLFNTKPELELLKSKLIYPIQRRLSLGSTNIQIGDLSIFNESLNSQNLIQATMCSSAIPVIFETQIYDDAVYCDGGVISTINVPTAVERCFEVTPNQNEIFVDVISCFRHVLDPDTKLKTLDVFFRTYEVHGYSKFLMSFASAMEAYPEVNFRYFFEPSEATSRVDEFNFTTANVEYLINLGNSDAQNIIKNPRNLRNEFKNWNPYKNIIFATNFE